MRIPVLATLCISILPAGGTLLEFPIRGTAPPDKITAIQRAISFETWDCIRHPAEGRGRIRLLRCGTCDKAMIRTDAKDDQEHHLRVDVRDNRLTIVTGPWTGIGLLRWSTIAAALEHSGLSLVNEDVRLRGHVLLELAPTDEAKPEALHEVLGAFGTVEGEPLAGPVLLRLADDEPVGHATVRKAARLAGYELEDTLWIVNRCSGALVTGG